MRPLQFLGVAGALLLAGCASFQPPMLSAHPPAAISAKAFSADRVPVALVLSGGSARGFAHVGVIKVLEKHGLKPDLIVGTSAGSIIGALYASGLTASELETTVARLDTSVFTDFVLPGFGFLPGELGFVRGEKLHRFVDAHLKTHLIEDFPIRFAAVATDLSTGNVTAFNSGDAGLAVVASSAVPGVITPVLIARRHYGDGQIASPLPISAARTLGAKIVVAVDVVYPPQDALLDSAVSVLFQAFAIAGHRLKESEKASADVVIAPALNRTTGQFTFADRQQLIDAGTRAAMDALPAIRSAFANAAPAR